MSSNRDGFSRDVELDVIGVAVEEETMLTYNITLGEQAEGEQERTKHRTLGNASSVQVAVNGVNFCLEK